LSKPIRIIYRRCNEINGADKGYLIREAVYCRIITGIETDKQVRILRRTECFERFRQI
jgi:hypothetical protein